MKKYAALLLAFTLTLSLMACGGDSDTSSTNGGDPVNSGQQQTQEVKPTDSQAGEGQTGENQAGESLPTVDGKTPAEIAGEIALSFGTYKGQPIVWQVLSVDILNGRALLITKDCLEVIPFHAEATTDLTWRTSDLRIWLIGEFHYSAFTDEEKARILEVENPQDTNSETGAREPEGYETTDTVFILSASEMQQYFADDEAMAGYLNGESFSYWTRTPGNDTSGYVCTYSGGGLYMTGNSADSTGVAVRPAIWVDLFPESDAN